MKKVTILNLLSLIIVSSIGSLAPATESQPESSISGPSFEKREKQRLSGLPFRRAVTPEESYRAYEQGKIQADLTELNLVRNFALDAHQQGQINHLNRVTRRHTEQISGLEYRTGQLEYRAGRIEQRVDQVEGVQRQHSYMLADHSQQLRAHGIRIGGLESSQAALSSRVTHLSGTVGSLSYQVAETQKGLREGVYGNIPEKCRKVTVSNSAGTSLYNKLAFTRSAVVPGLAAGNSSLTLLGQQTYYTTFSNTPMLSVNAKYHDDNGVPQSVSGFVPKSDVSLDPDCKF
jgi:hypothetical protein